MANLTEKATSGGAVTMTARHIVREASVTGASINGTNLPILGPIRTRELRRKTFMYYNSGSYSHTVLVKASPMLAMPATDAASSWITLDTETVTTGTWSDPLVFENDYEWMMVTVNGTPEAHANCWFIGTRDA